MLRFNSGDQIRHNGMDATERREANMSHWSIIHQTEPPIDLRFYLPNDLGEEKIKPHVEMLTEEQVERLGRERPPVFKSIWSEIAFVFSITMSQVISEYFISGFNIFIPTMIEDLGISSAASIWAGSSFSLVIASTLLVFGRLGDIVGGYPVYLAGLVWLAIWSLVAGFSVNPAMLLAARTLQGFGAAAFLPSGVMLMGSVYRPGPRKNVVFAIYGTFAVLGFFFGILLAGLVAEFTRWGFYFWIGSFVTASTLLMSIFSIPKEKRTACDKSVTMDWLGAGTLVPGIVLVIFAITESANISNGWRVLYIPTFFGIGCVFLLAALYIEGWVADQPLLPPLLFKIPGMKALLAAMMLSLGNMGIGMVYATLYFQDVLYATPIQIVGWYSPMIVGGLFFSTLEGFILHIISSRVLLIISGIGSIGFPLLLTLMPNGANFWAWIFPAMILGTMGIDLSINLMTIFITTQLPDSKQGLGGGVVNSVIQLGIAFNLGCGDIIQVNTLERAGLKQSYQNTFWFGTAAAIVSLTLVIIWVDIPKAKADYTVNEKRQLLQRSADEISEPWTSNRTLV